MALSKVHGEIPLASGTASVGANNLRAAINAAFDMSGGRYAERSAR
jgi:hypothetical protein